MRTKERLAAVLFERGLADLAKRALAGEYDDYESESGAPIHDLVEALRLHEADDLVKRAIGGEWDGSREEARQWYEREGKVLLEGR